MESNHSRRTPARLYCPTAADLLQPYQRYPAIIQAAILSVDTRTEFINLTRAQKTVLRTLLTRAEKVDGRKPIQVEYENAHKECGVSVKTIARTVDLLIAVGWLERGGEARDEYGVFTYRQFRFTPALCDLVGLPRRHRTFASRPVNKDLKVKEHQGETCAKAQRKTPEEINLTPGLDEAAKEFAMDRPGLAIVRGLACRAGHNPDHVVAVARAYLQKLKLTGNRAIAYLKFLAKKADDYAARAASILQHAAEQAQVSRSRDRAAAYAGRQYRAASGEIVRIFEHAAEVTRNGAWVQTIAGRGMQQLYDFIESGRLKPA